MKKTILAVGVLLLVLATGAMGCAAEAPPVPTTPVTTTPTAPLPSLAPPASVQGIVTDVQIQESTITVQTGRGDEVYDVDPDTGLLIGGVACSLELVESILLDMEDLALPCTVIYTTDDVGAAVYVDIQNPPTLTQGTGTVSSVDPVTNIVTILTDEGEEFTFDTGTGTEIFFGGLVCPLNQFEVLAGEGEAGSCKVLYYTDSAGNVLYVDANP